LGGLPSKHDSTLAGGLISEILKSLCTLVQKLYRYQTTGESGQCTGLILLFADSTRFDARLTRPRSDQTLVDLSSLGIESNAMDLCFLLLTKDRSARPGRKLIRIFNDIDRNLIVALERLLGVGPKRFHPALAIFDNRRVIDFEKQAALVNDAKESFVLIQPEAAEHPPRFEIIQVSKLIENKIFERLILLIHRAPKTF
jgi:hypothetical protein